VSSILEMAVQEAGLQPLAPAALTKFNSYLALLLKWNSKLNLTAVRTPEGIIRRHLVESIQCAQAIPAIEEPKILLDFGSGAGLPGVPIAICRPEIRVVLAESQSKKAAFLQEVVRVLALDAEVFDGRVEDMAAGARFAVVTLRAVDKMVMACRIAITRIAPGGWIVLFATEGTQSKLTEALPEIFWKSKLPIYDSINGLLMLGHVVQ
jgi:16S rRNA (guanine527-N7)-methyltransferase